MIVLTADFNFAELARQELRRAAPTSQLLPDLAPGVMPVAADFFPLAEQWRRQPPIFARHICPAQATVPLNGTDDDLACLRRAITEKLLGLVDPTLPFSVQTRIFADVPYKPFDVNTTLADVIRQKTAAPLDVRRPFQILSVVIAPNTAYLGLSLALHNLSDWAGGARRFAREEGQISRAEFKLLEALETFGIQS